MSKQRSVQIPGEPPKAAAIEQDVVQEDAQAAPKDQEGEAAADPEKEALRAQLAELTARLQAAEASKGKAKEPAAPVARVAGGAQKTEQGWIVPDTFGTPVKKG